MISQIKIRGRTYRLEKISSRFILSYGERSHRVDQDDNQWCGWICDCEDFAYRREGNKADPCKHILALHNQGFTVLSDRYLFQPADSQDTKGPIK
jgi:hypothetical protein